MTPPAISLTGLLLSILIPAGYFLLLRIPSVRNATVGPLVLGLLPFGLVGCALAMGRSIVTVIAFFFGAFFSLGFAYYLVRYSRLPGATGVIAEGDRAPAFTLPDQGERPAALTDALRDGPVALVFFRGGW